SNGTKVSHSFVIFTGGVEASTITSELEDVSKNTKGQIVVNEFMQTDKYENIFAIGDMAEVRNLKGEIMPPNVTIARISGTNAGRNVLNMIANKSLEKCDPKLDGILIALGGQYAAGDIYGILTVKGRLAYEIKKYVFSSYRAPLIKLIKKGYAKLRRL
ncbi:FAD-dependent oxidoreductase, partial [Aliarcobacter butzleri]